MIVIWSEGMERRETRFPTAEYFPFQHLSQHSQYTEQHRRELHRTLRDI